MTKEEIITLIKAFKTNQNRFNTITQICPWTNEAINMCINDLNSFGIEDWLNQTPENMISRFQETSIKLSAELIENLESVQSSQMLLYFSLGDEVYASYDYLSEVKKALSESTLQLDILMKYISIHSSIKDIIIKRHYKLLSLKPLINNAKNKKNIATK